MKVINSSIKLLQLPIPEVEGIFTEGNIPLAAGYLKSFALQEGAVEEEEIDIIPRMAANYAGDTALLKWLTGEETAVVGFTSYMWNIERNIFLARKVKEIRPDIKIIFGGPEIVPGQWFVDEQSIDSFAIGEGEQAFVDFLRDFKSGNPLKHFYQTDTPLNLQTVPNPYLENVLVPFQNESIYFETMRGCPYPCKYCFYSKSYSSVRFFPDHYLPGLFEMARAYKVSEIYIMDPSFNIAPGLEERLEKIAQLNSTGIPVHTEIRLESITPGIAGLMKKAGILSVEAGLQSVNEKSLSAVCRSFDKGKFAQGAKWLQRQNIDVKPGVILGLPFDGPGEIEHTLDFVIESNLRESVEFYFLSMLPGTLLRDEAESFEMTYMPHPPYWVTSTKSMTQNDFKYAVEMIEQKLDVEFFLPIIPRFENFLPGYIHFLDLRKDTDSLLNDLFRRPEKVGHSLTFLIEKNFDKKKCSDLGKWMKQTNPFTLIQVVIDSESLPSKKNVREISDAFYYPDHYFNRIHFYKIDFQERHSIRVFHLTGNPDIAGSYFDNPHYCDLILRYSPQLLKTPKGRDILDQHPVLLVDSPINKSESTQLKKIYKNFKNFLHSS